MLKFTRFSDIYSHHHSHIPRHNCFSTVWTLNYRKTSTNWMIAYIKHQQTTEIFINYFSLILMFPLCHRPSSEGELWDLHKARNFEMFLVACKKKIIKNFNFTMTIMVLCSLDCSFNVSFSVGEAFMKLHRNDYTDDDEKLFLLSARTFFYRQFQST